MPVARAARREFCFSESTIKTCAEAAAEARFQADSAYRLPLASGHHDASS